MAFLAKITDICALSGDKIAYIFENRELVFRFIIVRLPKMYRFARVSSQQFTQFRHFAQNSVHRGWNSVLINENSQMACFSSLEEV